jgi:hypothetical protein
MTTRVRQLAEIGAPGAVIGVIAGSVVGALSLFVGFPVSWAIVGVLTLGLPLALLGGLYGAIVGSGHVKTGTFAPAALFWLVGFPVSRLVYETFTPVVLGGSPTPPDDVLGFLAFQALVSFGFAIGFVWMFERITPPWLISIKDRNPAAAQLLERYTAYAAEMWRRREHKRARTADGRSSRTAAVSGSATGSRRSS